MNDFGPLGKAAEEQLRRSLTVIGDFPAPGRAYIDVFRSFDRHVPVRQAVIECLAARYRSDPSLTCVVGIATGAISFGSCLALQLGLPFVAIRKAGDTVHDAFTVPVSMVYAERELTLARDALSKEDVVLLCDDVLASGGSLRGAYTLLAEAGVQVRETAVLYEVEQARGRQLLRDNPIYSICRV